jgi:CRISPR-associated protein Csm2
MSYLKDHPINPDWFKKGISTDSVDYADKFAQHLVKEEKIPGTNTFVVLPLTTSQLRKFFGAVKNLQMNVSINGFAESDFIMLKPKLAYAVGRVRQKNLKCKERRIEDFAEVISTSIDITINSTNRMEAFKNFINFFEAIVAYHKRYGKENF